MPVLIYDPQEVSIIVNSTVLTGLAESMIEAEQTEDNFTEYVGALGEVSIAENANKTGVITVTLKNTSPSLAMMNSLANMKGLAAFVPVSIQDNNSTSVVISGTQCRVRKPATYNAGKEVEEVEFEIFVADFQLEPGQ